MQFILSILTFSILAAITSAYDASSKQNVALYWGQNSVGTKSDNKYNEKNLTYYCENADVDIVLLSFLNEFSGSTDVPTLTFNGYEFSKEYQDELTGLADQIETCQGNDKLVLLSLGGEGSGYGFQNDTEGSTFATTLWNMFGPANESTNSSVHRPFGDVLIDGFDLDAENKNETGYINLLYTLKQYINNTSTKDFYLSLAPQCPSTRNNLADVLSSNYFDFAFIQFYNNPKNCDANTDNFNWNWWANWAANSSRNKNVKIFLGLPGSSAAASSGYIGDADTLGQKVYQASQNSSFGGVSIFDAGTAFNNTDAPSGNYINLVKDAFDYKPATNSTSSSSNSSNSDAASTSTSTSKGGASGASGVNYQFSFLGALLFTLFNLF